MGTVTRLYDKLVNAVTGQGTSADARTSAWYAAPPPMTRQVIDAAYRGSGMMRKIINIPALDMVREWRDWKVEQDQITAIEAEEKRLDIRGKIKQAEVLRRLGGGALILGLPGDPSTPAPINIGKGQLAFIAVVTRWHLTFDAMQDDLTLPGYGEPLLWKYSTSIGDKRTIHPSRVVPFRADTASMSISELSGTGDSFWGESTVAQVLDAVKDFDTARGSFAALIHKARLTRVGIPGLMQISASDEGTATVQKRLQIMALAESIHNASIYDKGDPEGKGGEAIDDVTYSFAGAKDVLNAYAEFVCAISDIPATRLLGRAPEGMNSSGDSQQADWNKKVRAMQTLELAPCLDRIDPYLLQSAIGKVPDGNWYDFAPLDQPSEKDRANTFFLQAQAISLIHNVAAIPDQAFNRGVQSLLVDEGYMPELEAALLAIPEDERWGIVTEVDPVEPVDPNTQEGGGQTSVGEGGPIGSEPPRRAANDAPKPEA